MAGANRAGKKLATFALDGEVRFASAADRGRSPRSDWAAVTALTAPSITTTTAPRGPATTAW